MTDAAKKLMEEVLALPVTDRRRIGLALLESTEEESGGDLALHEAWRDELLRRIEQVESGKVKPIPGDEVEARLRAKFAKA